MDDALHALADFEQALLLDSTQADAHNGCGNVYRDQGDLPRALALDSQNASVYRNRGLTSVLLQEMAQALANLDQAVLYEPQHATACYWRGHIRCVRHEYTQALADYEQAIALNPND